MDFTRELERLRAEARNATAEDLGIIEDALYTIDLALDRLRKTGLTVDVSWPYGRGAVAQATSTKVTLGLSVSV